MALEQEIEGSDSRVEGPVRITALDGLIDNFIIPRLPRLLQKYPLLELTFISDMRLFDLSRREADVFIRSSKPSHPDAVGRYLGRQATAFYAARDIEFGDPPPIISLPRTYDETVFGRLPSEYFPRGRIVARASTEGHGLSLIRSGVGIGLADCFIGDIDRSIRRALPEPVATYDMWAIVHVEMRQAPRVRAVMDFFSEIYKEEADLIEGRRPR